MASISLNHIKKVYPGDIEVISDLNLQIKDKGVRRTGRTVRLRQIDHTAHDRGSGGRFRTGEMYIGDRKSERCSAEGPRYRDGFQNYALYPHMTVYKEHGVRTQAAQNAQGRDRPPKVHEAAKVLDIEHLLNRKPKQLSGGQRQRCRARTCDGARPGGIPAR